MPFTPYHFGSSGFFGLIFRRWVDVPVFLLANVLVDIEVIADKYLEPGWPVHQIWHFHTLLVGGLAGGILGLLIYKLRLTRKLCETSMKLIGLPYRATLTSMILGGIFGACLHVLIDSLYHYDVQIFWPYQRNPIYLWLIRTKHFNTPSLQQAVRQVCIAFWVLLGILYSSLLIRKKKQQ